MWGCRNIRDQYGEKRTKELYQWLTRRASLFRSRVSAGTASHTVRTEVTVEQHGTVVLLGGAVAGLDACPLCGSKLDLAGAEQARLRLQKGSISQDNLPSDGTSP